MSLITRLNRKLQKGFTLVELLVAISIIGIMGSMVLYALLGAQNDAKVARTRGTIQKINEIVLQKWEEYRYKPISVQPFETATSPLGPIPSAWVRAREVARVKMIVLRDTMRMEMPDRIEDLIFPPTHYTFEYVTPGASSVVGAGKLMRTIPPAYGLLYNTLRNQVAAIRARDDKSVWYLKSMELEPLVAGPLGATGPINRLTPNPLEDWMDAVESSELLYLLVSTCNYSGSSALEYFKPSEVGDVDGDGLLEFLDAWGRPINWIRWPAGYPGDLVRYADSDAMDPARCDWRYRQQPVGSSAPPIPTDWHPRTLVPLIVSAGSDGQSGIRFSFDENPLIYATMEWPSSPPEVRGVAGHAHYAAGPYYYPDPFFTWDFSSNIPNGSASTIPAPDGDAFGYRHNQLGSIPAASAEFAADNITSHDIILEP